MQQTTGAESTITFTGAEGNTAQTADSEANYE